MERIEVSSAHELPGHQTGRQTLQNYTGRYEGEIKAVEGHWEHDTFIVEIVEDADGGRARIDRGGRIIEV